MVGKLALGVMPDAGGSFNGSLPGSGAGGVTEALGAGVMGVGAGAALQAKAQQASKLARRFTAYLRWARR
jgi:hypothetical protein